MKPHVQDYAMLKYKKGENTNGAEEKRGEVPTLLSFTSENKRGDEERRATQGKNGWVFLC